MGAQLLSCNSRMEILPPHPLSFHSVVIAAYPLVKPVASFPSSTAVALLVDTIRWTTEYELGVCELAQQIYVDILIFPHMCLGILKR